MPNELFLFKALGVVFLVGIAAVIGILLESNARTRPDAATQAAREQLALIRAQSELRSAQRAEMQDQVNDAAGRLRTENCDHDALKTVVATLSANQENRKVVDLTNAFFARCGIVDEVLQNKLAAEMAVSDYPRAEATAQIIVGKFPQVPDYWVWLGNLQEQRNEPDDAIASYRRSLSLFTDPSKVAGSEFYRVSQALERQGRYCEAMEPLQQFVAYDPVIRRTQQITTLLQDDERRGDCRNSIAGSGRSVIRALANQHALIVEAKVNGRTARLALDTGATYVYLNADFAARAKVLVDTGRKLIAQTANGKAEGFPARIAALQVGGAHADGVTSVVQGKGTPPLPDIDGLLGLSFLNRFKLSVEQDQIVLEQRSP